MTIESAARKRHFSFRTRIALGLCASACLVTWAALSASGSTAQTAGATLQTVTVTAGKPTELQFKLSTKKVNPGMVTFKVTNQGRLPHNFELCSSNKGGSANGCKGKVTKLLAHGKSAILTVLLKKGNFETSARSPDMRQPA